MRRLRKPWPVRRVETGVEVLRGVGWCDANDEVGAVTDP